MAQQKSKRPKRTLDQGLKRKMALKNNHFSRYLLFRYSLALLFFSNVYWLLALIIQPSLYLVLPLGLLVLLVLACAEQFRLYGTEEVYLGKTAAAFKAQAAVQVLLLAVSLLPGQLTAALPLISDSLSARLFFAALQLTGLAICGWNLHRVSQIERNRDKFYHRFRQIKQHYN